MKTIKVVAAIIKNDNLILATQRGYGDFEGMWEFPGGKIELNETPEEAIIREIKEELDIEIKVTEFIEKVEYDYPEFHLDMDCFFCEIFSGDLILYEHQDARWLAKDELESVDWLPADLGLVEKIKEKI